MIEETCSINFGMGKTIIAIGRNYAEHAVELGNKVPSQPFYFLKPTASYVSSPGKIEIPKGVLAHHEIELAVVIGKGGREIRPDNALEHVAGYALAIDMTARNMQEEVKKRGLPWSAAKGFDTFTPISSFISKEKVQNPQDLNIWLKINGTTKQQGNTKDMIFPIPKLIEHVSSIMTLQENDVILTGTPSGVGPVQPGDHVTAGLSNPGQEAELATLEFSAEERSSGYQYK